MVSGCKRQDDCFGENMPAIVLAYVDAALAIGPADGPQAGLQRRGSRRRIVMAESLSKLEAREV